MAHRHGKRVCSSAGVAVFGGGGEEEEPLDATPPDEYDDQDPGRHDTYYGVGAYDDHGDGKQEWSDDPVGRFEEQVIAEAKKRSLREQFAIPELDGTGDGEDDGDAWPEWSPAGRHGDEGAKRRRVDTAGHYAASGSAGPDATTSRQARRYGRRHRKGKKGKGKGKGKDKDKSTVPLPRTPNGLAPPSPKPLPAGVHVRMRLRAPTPAPPPKPHHPKQPSGPPPSHMFAPQPPATPPAHGACGDGPSQALPPDAAKAAQVLVAAGATLPPGFFQQRGGWKDTPNALNVGVCVYYIMLLLGML